MSAVMADPAVDGVPVTRRPKKKLIVIGAAVLALVLALGAGTIVVLKQRAAHAAAAADEDAASPEASTQANAATALKGVPFYLPLDPFIVNLADREADRYAQIGITFEVPDAKFGELLRAYMPAIRNSILMILAQKSSADLLDRPGKEQLAGQIQREAARVMGIDVEEPEAPKPVAKEAAKDEAKAKDSGDEEKPKAKKRKVDAEPNPIRHVHFSNFIIQ